MKEKKIIVASHGTLAQGIVNALGIVVGDCGVETICCYTTPDFDLDRAIQETLSRVNYDTTEVYVFTDVSGGSVNNGFLKVLRQFDFHLFTNVNLAFLVNFILSESSLEEAREEAEGETFKVLYCNDLLTGEGVEDDL